MDLAGQEGAGGQHHGLGVEAQAGLGDDPAHGIAFDDQVIDGPGTRSGWPGLRRWRGSPCGTGCGRPGSGWRARRALGGVEGAPLDAGAVGGMRHRTAERVDFLTRWPLPMPPMAGCSSSHPRFRCCGSAAGAHAGAGRGQRGFGAGVATADDDDVVTMEGRVHGGCSAWGRRGRGRRRVAILAPFGVGRRRRPVGGEIGPKVGRIFADNPIAPIVAGAVGARDRIGTGAGTGARWEQRAGSRGTVRPCFGAVGKAPSTHGVDLLKLGLSPVGDLTNKRPRIAAVCFRGADIRQGRNRGIQMFLSDIDVELCGARVVLSLCDVGRHCPRRVRLGPCEMQDGSALNCALRRTIHVAPGGTVHPRRTRCRCRTGLGRRRLCVRLRRAAHRVHVPPRRTTVVRRSRRRRRTVLATIARRGGGRWLCGGR